MSRVDEFAQEFADAVRDAFIQAYGPPASEEDLESIYASWSDKGIRIGWHDPDPAVVVIGTERGWVEDPWSIDREDEVQAKWNAALKILEDAGWGHVGWDSINAAVHIVYWRMPPEWVSTLMKRSMEKGR